MWICRLTFMLWAMPVCCSNADSALREAVDSTLDTSTTHPAPQAAPKQTHSQVSDLVRSSRTKTELKKGGRALKNANIEDVAKKAVQQGHWYEILANYDSDLNWKASLAGLSEATYSFAIRSLVDCLPTNSNLSLWKRVLSDRCGSCSSKKQTLLHVLNNCHVKMNLYTWRHDNILFQLRKFVALHLPLCDIHCDLLVENQTFKEVSVGTVPIDIYLTNLRPDLVIIDRANMSVIILELTVPFETNFANAQERKCLKYGGVISGIEEAGYKCDFFSMEIGARGIPAQGTCKTLRRICKTSKKETREFVKLLVKVALKCSFVIFRERDNCNAKYNTVIN